MSAQTARKFLELLNTNRGLQTQFYISSPANLDKLLTFARGKGFIFTAEELEAALKDAPSNKLMDYIRAQAKVRA